MLLIVSGSNNNAIFKFSSFLADASQETSRPDSLAPGQLHYLAYQQAQNLAWLRRWHDRGAQSDWDPTSAADKPSGKHSPSFLRDSPFQLS